MADVDHEHGGTRALVLGLYHLQIGLPQFQSIHPSVLGVPDTITHGQLVHTVTEPELASVTCRFIALTCAPKGMATTVALLQGSEDLLQRPFTDELFGLARERGAPPLLRSFTYDAMFPQVRLELLSTVILRIEAMFLVHLVHPIERLLHITTGMGEQLQEKR